MIAVRRGHKLGARLSRMDGFLEARHVAVIGQGIEDMIDAWLRGLRIERRIALVVPSYLQALRMAARTDLVAFVPSRLVAALAEPLSLTALSPPVDPGMDEQYMSRPTRAHVDPASIWLRKLVLDIESGLDRQKLRAA